MDVEIVSDEVPPGGSNVLRRRGKGDAWPRLAREEELRYQLLATVSRLELDQGD